jgi:hypothetical protein
MSTDHMPPALAADYERWKARQNSADATKPPATFTDVKAEFIAAFESLPDTVEIPYAYTPEGIRKTKFDGVCPPEFNHKIDRALLPNPAAFDRVAQWDGHFRGPCAVGKTATCKSRAAWSALGRLWVKQNVGFSWWPVRKLIKDIEDSNGALEGLMYRHAGSRVFFIDDADKINWQFESHGESLFAFYDMIYRKNIPCITTTNKDRAWWAKKMGEAFARRLFDDACTEVNFS